MNIRRIKPTYLSLTLLLIALTSLAVALSLQTPVTPAIAASDLPIYTDSLASDWANWSWDTIAEFDNPSPTHSGSASLAVSHTGAWTGLYLHTDAPISTQGYTALRFWIHGGNTGGQQILVSLNADPKTRITAVANTWTQVTISMADLGNPAAIGDITWQDDNGGAQATYYLDDIVLVGDNATAGPSPTPSATPRPEQGPALSVDVTANRHAINPDIYGMNFPDEGLAEELGMSVARWGGNATSRYNWQTNISNRGMDWYYENVLETITPGQPLPAGSSTNRFVEQNNRTGTESILTMPLIGWTPKNDPQACGFSIAKYGEQQDADWQWRPDCGNGVRSNGSHVTGNDPLDTSLAIGPEYVSDWIAYLTNRYGTAENGGVRFYALDNEPMLWNDTHRDVHPEPASYDELRDKAYQYGAAIKAADPSAKVLGPVVWGWTAYFWSALDWEAGGAWWDNPQDRLAHGDTPFLEWYLQQMQAYENAHQVRILDYLDLHFYTQAAGVSLSGAGSAQTQAARLRSTRSLWDPTYFESSDGSWIDQPVMLIPRMQQWVTDNYPGTRLAITEYNWGALDHINGALAQADVLGIFGREGLDLATLWGPPSPEQPGAYAFRIFRNYNGSGGRFGETSVSATSSDQGQLAVYASQRASDNAVTILVINKTGETLSSNVALAHFSPAAQAQVYRYSAANLNAIVQQPNQAVTAAGFNADFPANSITMIVVPQHKDPLPPPVGDYKLYMPSVRR